MALIRRDSYSNDSLAMSFSQEERKFLAHANVSIILPQNSHLSTHEAFQSSENEQLKSLNEIRQRDVLFLDERLKIYVVLQVPEGPEDHLKTYLSRLVLNIEVWVADNVTISAILAGSAPSDREIVYSQTINHDEDPIVLVTQDDENGDGGLLLNLIWETSVILHRPRSRMSDTYIIMTPIATISPTEKPEEPDDYLVPFEVQEHNLLQPLAGMQGIGDIPFLPSSRLRPVIPRPPKVDHTYHLQSVQTDPIKAYQVGTTRLRYSRTGTVGSKSSMTVSLDLEITPIIDIHGSITRAKATLAHGTTKSLMEDFMPIDCRSRDCLTLLFYLESTSVATVRTLRDQRMMSSANIDVLTFSLNIEVKLGEYCACDILMEWTTNIDFSQALNQAFGPPSQSLQRSNRPISLPVDANDTSRTLSLVANGGLQSPAHEYHQQLSISFDSPAGAARVGVPFKWRVLVMNKTSKVANLAIIPLPRVSKISTQAQQYAKRHAPRSSVASAHDSERATGGDRSDPDTAPAFMDENVVYAMQHSGVIPPETDLTSLTPELRIGPLGIGQCYDGEIKIVAFRKGVLTFDAIRVVDLVKEAEGGGNPGTVIDIHDLPDVVVE